ncbi:hypothetical protein PITC_050060 [Penicillium italicum]|uniref:Uncharacterized protein n=1 Tax=Penicillium italicum TaxID=40296 RepID=A0A0A2K703_PENIT|nr:hypothetical protein PITC_050060 [Penicillium italicum]
MELGRCGELQLATRRPPDVSDSCGIHYGVLTQLLHELVSDYYPKYILLRSPGFLELPLGLDFPLIINFSPPQ